MKEKDLTALIDGALKDQIYFILDKDGNHVACDVLTWAPWFEKAENRIVKKTKIKKDTITRAVEYIEISTVFLGMSHGTDDKGRPLLYETAWFIDGDSEVSERCATREEALKMHKRVEDQIKTLALGSKRTSIKGKDAVLKIDGTEVAITGPISLNLETDTVSAPAPSPEELEARRNFNDAVKKL